MSGLETHTALAVQAHRMGLENKFFDRFVLVLAKMFKLYVFSEIVKQPVWMSDCSFFFDRIDDKTYVTPLCTLMWDCECSTEASNF